MEMGDVVYEMKRRGMLSIRNTTMLYMRGQKDINIRAKGHTVCLSGEMEHVVYQRERNMVFIKGNWSYCLMGEIEHVIYGGKGNPVYGGKGDIMSMGKWDFLFMEKGDILSMGKGDIFLSDENDI